jgi:leader peptidase (prepilin peptidase)/N-methyltransferase
LLAVSGVDSRIKRIPDRIVFPAFGATLALVAVTSYVVAPNNTIALDLIKAALVGMITYFAILCVFHVISPKGMGFGDVKLSALMGLALGWVSGSNAVAVYLVCIALFLCSVFGVLFGLALRVGLRKEFPFGPALAVACFYVIIDAQRFLAR